MLREKPEAAPRLVKAKRCATEPPTGKPNPLIACIRSSASDVRFGKYRPHGDSTNQAASHLFTFVFEMKLWYTVS